MMDGWVERLPGYASLTLTKECDGRDPIPLIISLVVCVTLSLKGLPFATPRPQFSLPSQHEASFRCTFFYVFFLSLFIFWFCISVHECLEVLVLWWENLSIKIHGFIVAKGFPENCKPLFEVKMQQIFIKRKIFLINSLKSRRASYTSTWKSEWKGIYQGERSDSNV